MEMSAPAARLGEGAHEDQHVNAQVPRVPTLMINSFFAMTTPGSQPNSAKLPRIMTNTFSVGVADDDGPVGHVRDGSKGLRQTRPS